MHGRDRFSGREAIGLGFDHAFERRELDEQDLPLLVQQREARNEPSKEEDQQEQRRG